MLTSRRTIVLALVLIGLAFAALTGSIYIRAPALAEEASRGRRDVLARRAIADATGLAALAVAAAILAGFASHRLARRRASDVIAAQSAVRAALEQRTEALHREREALDEAELASHFKDDFLANVSHELRTPLNAIVGWSSVLKRGMLTGADRDRAIEAVDRNATALTRIVNDLLDVSHLMQGQLKLDLAPVDLRDVARAAAATLAPACAAKRITVGLRLDRDRVAVSADGPRMQQIVWHLVSNAVKFTPAGGSIKVEVSRFGSRALLRVSDSGAGIDSAALPHIFEPFRQRVQKNSPGLGVGLAIVRHVAELHGGAVDAESQGRGRGAVFTLTLPLMPRVHEPSLHPVGRRARAPVDTVN
jgi:signal transduction histidine kinase